jgi:peptidyl-prolyl cis-trans isomerase B (cyclophilin B)
MKKVLLITTALVLSLLLTACTEETKSYDIPREESISLNELPYSEFIKLGNPTVTITVKDMGDIVIQLFPDEAPNTVANFIAYAQRGDYENNEFHRVVQDFMIQGGKLDSPSCTIVGEMNNNPVFDGDNNVSHVRGVISMARVGGLYNSQSSQFFIVHQNATFLDDEYAAFGGVIRGFNILDFIAEMNTDSSTELPYEPVYIENITVELNDYELISPVCE